LTALVFGVMSLTPEAGAAELLFAQPVGRATIQSARLTGVFLALAVSETVGFGLAGLVLFIRTGTDGAAGFAGVWLAAAVLTAVFLALASALAGGGTSDVRARTLAVALVAWFVAVVLFDVAALGAASLLPSGTASRLLMVAALVNPVDAVRTGTLLALEGTTAFGGASLAFLRFTGGATLAAVWITLSIATWLLVPWLIGAWRLRRSDL
jgi:Cu-processing system permease protein